MKEYKKTKDFNCGEFSLGKVSAKSGGETISNFSLSKTSVPKGSGGSNSPNHFGMDSVMHY